MYVFSYPGTHDNLHLYEKRENSTDGIGCERAVESETMFLSITVAVFWAYLTAISISVLVSHRVQRILKAMHECIRDTHSV